MPDFPIKSPRKLIEVALPLDAINVACAAEKQPGIGAHPRGLHLWWARRPLTAARAVIFAQLVNDPGYQQGGGFKYGKNKKDASIERKRLFKIIEDLVQWENTTNEEVLERARAEIRRSWREVCELNKDHPQAAELFNPDKLPALHDPFAGGGAIPLEAQRLGLEAYASDLNPVAVLINKAMIEIPPKFAGMPPVSLRQSRQVARKGLNLDREWHGATGLAEDVRYYGAWMREEAEKRIGHLYPPVEITAAMAKERPDLKPLVGQELSVIAWVWARTVKSPNPAFSNVDVPLASTFMLATKPGKKAYVAPVIENGEYRFTVKVGEPKDAEASKRGSKSGGSHSAFLCLMSGTPMPFSYLRNEATAGRMSVRLMAAIAQGKRGRVYLSPTSDMETIAHSAKPEWKPESEICHWPGRTNVVEYGMTHFGDLFTPRQLVALTTFSSLVTEARARILGDALTAGMSDVPQGLQAGGITASAYAEAVTIYLAFAISRLADYNSSITTWKSSGEQVMQTFKRQAIPMTWDFTESNILGDKAISWQNAVKYAADNLTATVGRIVPIPGNSVAGRCSNPDCLRWEIHLHRSSILRQHRLRWPVRFFLCLVAEDTARHLSIPLFHDLRS